MDTFTVTVRGSTSALLAFTANLDRQVRPLIIRTGSEWKRIRRTEKELLGEKVEEVELKIECCVVDFSGVQ